MSFCARVLGLALTALVTGCSRGKIERVEWPVMGTIAAVQTRGATPEETAETVRAVKTAFARVERLMNAHDPNSELNRLAPLAEPEILERCDPAMRACYARAFALARDSGGAFNPRWRGAATLDLGAIAKGFAVDCAADAVGCPKDFDVLVDLGGNLRSVKGSWRTAVGGTDEVFVLDEGFACATSAEYFRGKHIYDGRTGRPVSNDVSSVTVVADRSASEADGLSTTLFVLGPVEGVRFLDGPTKGVGARILWMMRDGRRISHVRRH